MPLYYQILGRNLSPSTKSSCKLKSEGIKLLKENVLLL